MQRRKLKRPSRHLRRASISALILVSTLSASVKTGLISQSAAEHQRLFQQILQHTRTSSDDCIRPLFTRRGVQVLSSCAFGNPSDCDQLIALRCLNNILARAVTTRQLFVEEGCPEKVLELMKVLSAQTTFGALGSSNMTDW